MWKISTISTLAWKAFDTVPDEQKKAILLWAIETIENNEKFQKAKKYWDELDEEHKIQYYNDWWGSWKFLTTWPLTPKISKKWIRIDVKDNLYTSASPLMRLWVSFWLLGKPKDLEDEKLIKNIKKDAKNLNRYIKLLNITCKTIPELRELVPFVTQLEPYAKRYEKNWASLMQEKMRQDLTRQTEKSIAENLSASEENILESQIPQN